MTFWQWVQTWWFWAPVILVLILFTWLVVSEMRDKEVYLCPTCYSDKKKVRYSVRYWMSDNLSTLEPCEDPWHGKYVDPY